MHMDQSSKHTLADKFHTIGWSSTTATATQQVIASAIITSLHIVLLLHGRQSFRLLLSQGHGIGLNHGLFFGLALGPFDLQGLFAEERSGGTHGRTLTYRHRSIS